MHRHSHLIANLLDHRQAGRRPANIQIRAKLDSIHAAAFGSHRSFDCFNGSLNQNPGRD